jgi:hypothetical protein
MDLNAKSIIDEYKSITDDKLYVVINGTRYMNMDLNDRKTELNDALESIAVKVMKQQIDIARKHELPAPYCVYYCDYKIVEVTDTTVTLCFRDMYDSHPSKWRETISFETIINFDSNEYEMSCINLCEKSLKKSVRRVKTCVNTQQKEVDKKLKKLKTQKEKIQGSKK